MGRLVIVTALLVATAGMALAHGGSYGHHRPGEYPPGWRRPWELQHRGGGTIPAGIPLGRQDPPPPPPLEGSDKATTPGADRPGQGTPKPRALTLDSWLYWWEYNRDDLLDLRTRRGEGAATVSGVLRVGAVHGRCASSRHSPSELIVEREIVPALESLLHRKVHYDTRCAAIIALAKIGSTRSHLAPRIAGPLISMMRNRGDWNHLYAQETAALALGVLGCRDERIVHALRDRLLDRRGTKTRPRAFAALALGLLELRPSDPAYLEAADALRSVVASKKENKADVPVCALLGMGLSGDVAFLPGLLEMIRIRELDDLRRSYAVSAVGRLAESVRETARPDVVGALGKVLFGDGAHARSSAAIALGAVARRPELAPGSRLEIARWLDQVIGQGDARAARFAMISLGRLAAASGFPDLRRACFRVLARAMISGGFDDRPYGALALGLMGADGRDAAWIRETVRREFVEGRGDARNRSAFALALGLLRDRGAISDLLPILEDDGEAKVLRGASAEALGLIGDRVAVGPVHEVLVRESDPGLRPRAATAAGMLGDRSVVPDLLAILEDRGTTLHVRGSTCLALGRLGDRRAVGPLLDLALDLSAQNISRALAVVALGLVADENEVPVLSRLSRDVNYRAPVDALREALTIL